VHQLLCLSHCSCCCCCCCCCWGCCYLIFKVLKVFSAAVGVLLPGDKPQTLLFSATVPRWVQRTARKYLRSDIVKLDLVGEGTVRTATSVQVRHACSLCFVAVWV